MGVGTARGHSEGQSSGDRGWAESRGDWSDQPVTSGRAVSSAPGQSGGMDSQIQVGAGMGMGTFLGSKQPICL